MRFLISGIDERTGSATADEMAAIAEFNRRLREAGQFVFAGGLEDPAAAAVVDGRRIRRSARRGRCIRPASMCPASGLWKPRTGRQRCGWRWR